MCFDGADEKFWCEFEGEAVLGFQKNISKGNYALNFFR